MLSREHNLKLGRFLRRLGCRYPGVRVIYADLYAPIVDFAVSPDRYGFNGTGGVLSACCGAGGGKNNFNAAALCGMPGVTTGDLSAYVSWDGIVGKTATNHHQ